MSQAVSGLLGLPAPPWAGSEAPSGSCPPRPTLGSAPLVLLGSPWAMQHTQLSKTTSSSSSSWHHHGTSPGQGLGITWWINQDRLRHPELVFYLVSFSLM